MKKSDILVKIIDMIGHKKFENMFKDAVNDMFKNMKKDLQENVGDLLKDNDQIYHQELEHKGSNI